MTPRLRSSDGHGGTASATVTVVVGNPPGNQAPTVLAAADPATGTSPLTVQFTSAARDPDGDPMMYEWAFGDGGQAAGATPGTPTRSRAPTTRRSRSPTRAAASAPRRSGSSSRRPRRLRPRSGAPTSRPDAPAQAAWFGVSTPAKTTVGRLRGARAGGERHLHRGDDRLGDVHGRARTARSLRLRRPRWRAGSVRCAGAGQQSVTLKPSAAIKRALAKARGSVKVTLGVRLRATGEPASRTAREVKLARR